MSSSIGEQQAISIVPPGAGDAVNVLGDTTIFKVSRSATGEDISVMEVITPPGGGPPALHTHAPLEVFYVLEGEYEIQQMGTEGPVTSRASKGTTVYIPKGTPHNYKNNTALQARMLAIFTVPTMESFFRDLSKATERPENAPPGPPDMAKVMPVLHRYEVEFVGPPPGRE